ncbi:hypothetical protein LOD99_6594 [Oopsacas minuta]|uniref:Uncharacterized protein n=1 Tax=Oopsacas minuta TaxID=111878 RepID=A0AAV7JN41_9METZ|nr:hypothetical protein LOD99_6594 [Oopsacas minuta]
MLLISIGIFILITTTITNQLRLEIDLPARPDISENFFARVLSNLSTNSVNVQNNITLNRMYSEGKQCSRGCQVWKGRPGKECSYTLVREDLKLEYAADIKNNTLQNCYKTVLNGDEIIKLWKWILNATYLGREKDNNGDMVDIWHQLEADGDTSEYLENKIAVSTIDPNIPVYVKQTYRSSENSDNYVFRYYNFTTKVSEDEFKIPTKCNGV